MSNQEISEKSKIYMQEFIQALHEVRIVKRKATKEEKEIKEDIAIVLATEKIDSFETERFAFTSVVSKRKSFDKDKLFEAYKKLVPEADIDDFYTEAESKTYKIKEIKQDAKEPDFE